MVFKRRGKAKGGLGVSPGNGIAGHMNNSGNLDTGSTRLVRRDCRSSLTVRVYSASATVFAPRSAARRRQSGRRNGAWENPQDHRRDGQRNRSTEIR
jgi:hypothetical protein